MPSWPPASPDVTAEAHLERIANDLRVFGETLATAFKPISEALGAALKECYDALLEAHDRDPHGFHAAMWDPGACPFDEGTPR
jgi:hypothetical protein